MSIPDDPAYLLADARQNLIDADREPPGSTRRPSFAHHAETQCADLILRPESSETQRAQASVFLEQAQAIQKEPATRTAQPSAWIRGLSCNAIWCQPTDGST